MKTSGPLWWGGGPTRHSCATTGIATMEAAALSTARRLIFRPATKHGPHLGAPHSVLCWLSSTSRIRSFRDGLFITHCQLQQGNEILAHGWRNRRFRSLAISEVIRLDSRETPGTRWFSPTRRRPGQEQRPNLDRSSKVAAHSTQQPIALVAAH